MTAVREQQVATTNGTEAETELDLPDPSGYSIDDDYFANRYHQGGRVVYSVDLSIPQLVQTLPEPDPDVQQPGNRRITLSHARSFGDYVRERSNWVCPSLLLRAPDGVFRFNLEKEIGGNAGRPVHPAPGPGRA